MSYAPMKIDSYSGRSNMHMITEVTETFLHLTDAPVTTSWDELRKWESDDIESQNDGENRGVCSQITFSFTVSS